MSLTAKEGTVTINFTNQSPARSQLHDRTERQGRRRDADVPRRDQDSESRPQSGNLHFSLHRARSLGGGHERDADYQLKTIAL
jgi:hypothetical protein